MANHGGGGGTGATDATNPATGSGKLTISAIALKTIAAVISVAFIGLILAAGVGVNSGPPRHARVFVHVASGKVISPPCIRDMTYDMSMAPDRVWRTTWGEAMTAGRSLDDKCRNAGGFEGHHVSLLREWLGWRQNRWNPDGGWAW